VKPPLLDQGQYLLLLKQIAALFPPLFIMGGFAEDALLYHRITRQHNDLDVLIVRSQLNQCLQQLKSLGLAEFEVSLEESPGRPAVLSARADSLHLEIGVSDPAPGGGYHFVVEDGQHPSSRFRISLPEDTFQYPATTIGGVTIQTVSPLALYQLRAISALTRSVGEMRANDLAMQEKLRKTFLAGQDERQLKPKLVKL
jgi:hypothetical protein